MKGLLLAGSIIGSVLASAHDRHEMFHRRHGALTTGQSSEEACAAVTTYTTYYYAEPTLVQDAPKPKTTSSSTSTPTPSSTSTPTPTPSSSEAPSSTPAASSTEPAGYGAVPSKVPDEPKVNTYSSPQGGAKWAITYTPYAPDGGCTSADQVKKDLAEIKRRGFSTVRTYSTDCDGLKNIGAAARENGLKLILGVYINGSGCSGAEAQVQHIVDWAQWDLVSFILVGNEALFNKFTTPGELNGFIKSSRSRFRAAGYNGPVSTTETVHVLQEVGSQLCDALDVIGANIHAYFNSGTSAEEAGDFVVGQLAIMEGICPGLQSYNFETGWPTSGATNGKAVPGRWQQHIAMKSILDKVGYKSVAFSFGNDPWKAPGGYGAEQFFGCLDNLDN